MRTVGMKVEAKIDRVYKSETPSLCDVLLYRETLVSDVLSGLEQLLEQLVGEARHEAHGELLLALRQALGELLLALQALGELLLPTPARISEKTASRAPRPAQDI